MTTHEINTRRLGWVIIVVAILMTIQTIVSQVRLIDNARDRQDSLECLGQWAQDFATALDARTAATADTNSAQHEHDQAVDDVLLIVLDGLRDDSVDLPILKAGLEKFQRADQNLDQARRDNLQTRRDNPYPDPPSTCVD